MRRRRTFKQTKAVLDRVLQELQDPRPVWLRLRMMELRRGHYIVPPGSVPWLPIEEWVDRCCVSIADGEVRLVLIEARHPGTGAFRRLVSGVQACGLVPVVVCPSELFEATLRRWKWRHSEAGETFEDHEDQWRPA